MDTTHSLQARLWQEVLLLSFALTGVVSILFWPLWQSDRPYFLFSVLATVSGLLLAMSFSLSSFAYYCNFLDSKVVYRKQLGLMGYFVALAYAIGTAIAKPEIYIEAFPANLWTVEVGLGAGAMAIFTMMALISNAWAPRLLGGKLWKDLLGLGYIAYAFLVIRAIFLDAALWQNWLWEDSSIMTPRMMLTILGTLVLCFRASVPIHKQFNNKTNYV